jgi:hypothetical protein
MVLSFKKGQYLADKNVERSVFIDNSYSIKKTPRLS